ncbi:MAG: hypothetical protein ACFE8E_13200 [Candidatus Hodarchaeota archaeon]
MYNTDDDLIKEAERLENTSKIEIRNKNYDNAVSMLLEAKDIYTRLGLTGQVGIILKEIVRIKNIKREDVKPDSKVVEIKKEDVKTDSKIIDISPPIEKPIKMEVTGKEALESKGNDLLEEARKLALNDELDEALKLYNEAYDVFKRINYNYECKQILWQINEIREYQKWNQSRKAKGLKVPVKDIISLAAAQRRRLRIQEHLQEEKQLKTLKEEEVKPEIKVKKEPKSYKLFEQISEKDRLEEEQKKAEKNLLQKQKEQRTQVIKERMGKLRQLKEQKSEEESFRKTAEEHLGIAKGLVQKRDYEQAKLYYEKAIEIFSKLGWLDQVKVLRQEVWNIDRYKKEYEHKRELELIAKQKAKDEFEKRVESISIEQKKYQEKALERMRALPPEVKVKLEKIELIRKKADKEESMNNFSRVLERYKYILELYLSIPNDVLDLTEEISNIKQKLSELETKL